SEPKFQALREHKKINAGAQFFQTNLVYDPDGLEIWLNELAKRDVLDKVYILIGITPLKSLKMAEYMHHDVPGVSIPQKILTRLEKAGEDAAEEGVQICLELIEQIKGKEGVNGIHLMPVAWEKMVPRIVEEAGLLPVGFKVPEPAV
ncbi:MAG: methylenetetrahydrofolate reductase, partial [Chloroflexota bacterium]